MSSPLAFDQADVTSSSTFTKRSAPALPDVQEHPLELDDHQISARMSFEQVENPKHPMTSQQSKPQGRIDTGDAHVAAFDRPRHTVSALNGQLDESDVRFEPFAKRRRSGESTLDSITSRFLERLPSLVKHKTRKRGSTFCSESNSAVVSPVPGRSRSSSRARTSLSIFRKSDAMDTDTDAPRDASASGRFETINEVDDLDVRSEPRSGEHAKPEDLERVHTPLLPMFLDDDNSAKEVIAANHDPCDVVDSVISDCGYDSLSSIQHTPQLSAKASTTFVQTSHSRTLNEDPQAIGTPDLPMLAEPEDEWSESLGHANFFIQPKPYSPDHVSAEACNALLFDWEKARSEYSKHLARTTKHFGHSSKTYRLTEEKWAAIDATWRRNYDKMRAMASIVGAMPLHSPVEPAPVVRIPSLDDKFPQLSDFEVVGAMERIDPPQRASTQIKRDSSVRNGLKKLIDGLNKRSRSVSGPQ
ncbi:MAG: hypothetical protein Q9162_007720 [Coniocarpon cinnabarinum]